MNHLSHDALWAAAKESPVGDDYAHLQLCPDCRAQVEDMKFAVGTLFDDPASMPVLPDASARRIGDVLRKAAEKEARSRLWWSAWWPFAFNPGWALAPLAAVFLAFVAYRYTESLQPNVLPAPIAKAPEVLPAPSPAPLPEPEQLAVAPVPAVKKVVASVTSASNARQGKNVPLKKSQQLEEGSTVATSRGGKLWLQLPDGSRAGLTGASQVHLAKLEEKAVTLDITQGSMMVVARHDPSRELRVRAGDLQVIDVGTQFLVSRDGNKTLVAVEEGEVEVEAGDGKRVPVRAGQAVVWNGTKLARQAWAPTAAEAPKAQNATQVAAADETPPIPAEGEKPVPPAPVAEAAQQKPPEQAEWATPENLKDAPTHQPPPMPAPEPQQPPAALPVPVPPTPAPVAAQAPAPTTSQSEDEADVGFLRKLETKLRRIGGSFQGPTRLQRANDIAQLADRRECSDAIGLADEWLTEAVPRGESFNIRRSVLSSKLRCLQYQGRTGDAAAVQRELDKL